MRRRSLLHAGLVGGFAGGLAAAGLAGTAGPAAAAEAAEPEHRRDWRPVAADVRNELLHTWNSYRRFAFGHDQLLPVSSGFSEFFDDAHPVGLTIVEALDTLFFMGLDRELDRGVDWIRDHLDFRAVTQPVQIFETNIRMIGGLLSGFLCTGDKVLLRKAKDIADVLLPAFEQSPTGLPFRFVVPATGELSGTTNVLAEIGTIIAEFGTLSRLVHDDKYYNAAKKALKAVFDRRSPLDLVGTSMDITTGAWISPTSSVNPPVDSFFEYLFDAWDLFRDREIKGWYDTLTAAILKFQRETFNGQTWFRRVNKDTGAVIDRRTTELTAFYAGLLGQSGHLRTGVEYFESWTSLLDKFTLLPEVIDYSTLTVIGAGNQLRPEYVDSALNLWLVTGREVYRERAFEYYLRQKRASRVANGWTIATDVTTNPVTLGDLTPGYWWSEQMKYWYLMFSGTERFDYRNNYLSTEGDVFRGIRRVRS